MLLADVMEAIQVDRRGVTMGMKTIHTRSIIDGGARLERAWLAPAIAGLVILGAACTGPATGSPTAVASSPGEPSQGAAASIQVATISLGKVLVDGEGKSLYLFEADTGSESTCSGPCAAAWPPLLTTGTPTASGDASTSMLGTTTRSDGGTQVTYDGHPLYYYSGDSKAGDINGEGSDAFGAEWYLVSPAGKTVEDEEEGGNSEGASPSGEKPRY